MIRWLVFAQDTNDRDRAKAVKTRRGFEPAKPAAVAKSARISIAQKVELRRLSDPGHRERALTPVVVVFRKRSDVSFLGVITPPLA